MRGINRMKRVVKWLGIYQIPLYFFGGILALAIYSSCANPGMPQGGPIDSIPPVVMRSVPANNDTNVVDPRISVTFDEYVVTDNLRDKLVVSPPLKKSIQSKMRGKTVLIELGGELRPNMTYAIDFQDGIKDNNQGNVLEDFRIRFSTGNMIDTLQLSGYVIDAFNLEPLEKISVVFYQEHHDTLFTTTTPDYLARSNDEGEFFTNNLQGRPYKVCAIEDGDNNLFFSQAIERIGFLDSLVIPSAEYFHQPDTMVENGDTIAIHGFTTFAPEPFFLRMFLEETYNQYIVESKRSDSIHMSLIFNEETTDSFKMELVGYEDKYPHWAYVEKSEDGDSVDIWIVEPEVYKDDSLYLAVNYIANDSLNRPVLYADTLKYFMPKKKKEDKKKKKDDEEEEKIPMFKFSTNAKGSNFNLNQSIILTTKEPLESIDTSVVKLEWANTDSTYLPLEYQMVYDTLHRRKVVIKYPWESETKYRLVIDSASVYDMYGVHNEPLNLKLTTRSIDFYSTLSFNIEGVEGALILQLLKGSKEEVLATRYLDSTKREIQFDYLEPQAVMAKIIVDRNGNGKWDTGNYEEKIQPEDVFYFPKKITLKSNFEFVETWIIDPKKDLHKEIVDPDAKEEDEHKGHGHR